MIYFRNVLSDLTCFETFKSNEVMWSDIESKNNYVVLDYVLDYVFSEVKTEGIFENVYEKIINK